MFNIIQNFIHCVGKGEVESSILSGSTSKINSDFNTLVEVSAAGAFGRQTDFALSFGRRSF